MGSLLAFQRLEAPVLPFTSSALASHALTSRPASHRSRDGFVSSPGNPADLVLNVSHLQSAFCSVETQFAGIGWHLLWVHNFVTTTSGLTSPWCPLDCQ